MYKLIASDLDGTLLTPEHHVSAKTKAVIRTLVQRGFPFVIATGRHFLDVNDICSEVGTNTYVITANGARVHNQAGEMVYRKNIEPPMVRALLRPEFCAGTVLNMYRDDGWFINQPLPWLLDMHETSGFQYQLFDPAKHDGQGVSKVFYVAGHAHLLNLKSRLEAHFGPDTLAMTFSIPDCLEVMHKTVSKGEALQQVARLQGISLAECLAFGDGLNDYEMLSIVGKGLIMANAHEALKVRLPLHEVIGRNVDDGVAAYLGQLYQITF